MKVVSVIFFLFIAQARAAKILGIFNVPGMSHHILGESLLKALAAKGHDVTMLSSFKSKSPPNNFKQLVLTEPLRYKNDKMANSVIDMQNYSFLAQMTKMITHLTTMERLFFEEKIVKQLIESNRQYDLAIVVWYGNDAMLALSHHVANLTIILSPVGSTYTSIKLTKVPMPFSYVPNVFPPLPEEMTFTQRLANTLYSELGMFLSYIFSCYQRYEIDKYIPNSPSSDELYQHVSLILYNTHYSIESPRPYVPSMIQIGGFHIEDTQELPRELKELMDNANEGVIFFSLGSNARSADIPQDKIISILKSFSNLPYTVLWKFEENIENLPKNVKLSGWFPQRDILAHKNVKLFITHGGLLSTIEAVYHGVPMIGIPIFGDQSANVLDGVVKGYLYHLPLTDLTEQTFSDAIWDVIKNPRYRGNIKKRSLIFRDQQVKPIDKATYWVEYVLRHEGAHHLKTSALKLAWYQHYLVDVGAVIFIAVVVLMYTIYKLTRFICLLLCRNRKKNIKKRKPKTS